MQHYLVTFGVTAIFETKARSQKKNKIILKVGVKQKPPLDQ